MCNKVTNELAMKIAGIGRSTSWLSQKKKLEK